MSEEITNHAPAVAESKNKNFFLVVLFAIFLLILGGSLLILYSKQFAGLEPSLEVDYPAKGERITIDAASTAWIDIQEGDVAEDEVVIIPEVTLQLNKQSRGRLVAFFRDFHGDTVGDSFSIDLSPETLSSSQATLTLTSTAGYKERSDFRGYLFSEPPYWSLILKESTSEGVKEICTIPIPPTELKTK